MQSKEQAAAIASLVREMALGLADAPGEVQVTSRMERGVLRLDLAAAPGDVGRLIGRGGATARSLRAIVTAACARMGLRYELNIVDQKERP